MTNFIGQWYLKDNTVCDDVINFFKHDKYALLNKEKGRIYRGVDENIKKSTDLSIPPSLSFNRIFENYFLQLQQVCENYIKTYPWCNSFAKWALLRNVVIQHYKPSEGFYNFHCERTGANNNRHLVFMTYLNDVTDAGETEWYHQKIKIQPKKGLTVIWPVDWTHTHRGIPSLSQEKYIITGWYEFIP